MPNHTPRDANAAIDPTVPHMRRSVCVYCGSRPGAHPKYAELAKELGATLARADIRLVYGAGDQGLMGAAAQGCKAAGGETLGFIPDSLWRREVQDRSAPDVVVTENLHQRKSLMLANSQAAIVLPGGVGTLDEFIEAATWGHLGLHQKPIVLLDPDGYWSPLMDMFERMAQEGFLWREFAPDQTHSAAAFAIVRSADEAVLHIQTALDGD